MLLDVIDTEGGKIEERNDETDRNIEEKQNPTINPTDFTPASMIAKDLDSNIIQCTVQLQDGDIERTGSKGFDKEDSKCDELSDAALLQSTPLKYTIDHTAVGLLDNEDCSIVDIDDDDEYCPDEDDEDVDIVDMCVVDTQQSMADSRVVYNQQLSDNAASSALGASPNISEGNECGPSEVVADSQEQILPDGLSASRNSWPPAIIPLRQELDHSVAHSQTSPMFPYTFESHVTSSPPTISVSGPDPVIETKSLQSEGLAAAARMSESQSSATQFTPLIIIDNNCKDHGQSQEQRIAPACALSVKEGEASVLDPDLGTSTPAATPLKNSALSISFSGATEGSESNFIDVGVNSSVPFKAGKRMNINGNHLS